MVMMQCPNCNQQTEEGKFCTNCGASLSNETTTQDAATVDTATQAPQTEQQTSDIVEQVKAAGSNFGHFFMTLVKKPSAAVKANGNDVVSGIISVVIFALLLGIGYYILLKNFMEAMGELSTLGGLLGSGEETQSVPFTDGFLWPFLKFIILFAIIIGLSYACLKVAKSNYSIQDTIAKYGAYLIPFTLLLVIGFILTLVNLSSIGVVAILVSLVGILMIVPTLVINHESSESIDKLYLVIIGSIINIVVFWYVIKSLFTPFLESGFGDLFSNFF